jgi:hypothetical protein
MELFCFPLFFRPPSPCQTFGLTRGPICEKYGSLNLGQNYISKFHPL